MEIHLGPKKKKILFTFILAFFKTYRSKKCNEQFEERRLGAGGGSKRAGDGGKVTRGEGASEERQRVSE